MRKYNSESYLRRNIITNPIFHFSVELKFAKHVNARMQSVFLLTGSHPSWSTFLRYCNVSKKN